MGRKSRTHEQNKIHAAKKTDDYRQWIANGTPEQKALWELERKLHNKPEKKAEYMEVVNRLQEFLPPSPMDSHGKYSSGGGVKTMDEKAARQEIARLSENARGYLAHNLRNPLQIIVGGIEIGSMETIREGVQDLKHRIERAGL